MSNNIGVAVLCFALWQQTAAVPESVLIPEAAKQLLEGNAKELDGLEFHITVERRFLAQASKLPAELQPFTDKAFLEHYLAPEVNIVRIDSPRFYQKSIQGLNGVQIGERGYNGRILYSGRPPAADAESLLTIDNVDRCLAEARRSGIPTKHFYWNYFDEAAYHLPEFPHELGESSSSLVLHLAKKGRVVSWLDNSTTGMHEVVLEAPDPWSQLKLTPEQIKAAVSHLLGESKKIQEGVLQRRVERSESEPLRRYRFSLDPALGFAAREKWEETSKGELLSHTVCEEFSQVGNRKVWLPKACRVLLYASENFPSHVSPTPLYEITIKLKTALQKVFSEKEFELWYDTPGGRVFDYVADTATVDEPVQYQVPANASELAKASRGAVMGLSKTRWVIIINFAILGIIAIYMISRRSAPNK